MKCLDNIKDCLLEQPTGKGNTSVNFFLRKIFRLSFKIAIREHFYNSDGSVNDHSEFMLEQWKAKYLLHLGSEKLLKYKGKVNEVESLQARLRLFQDITLET